LRRLRLTAIWQKGDLGNDDLALASSRCTAREQHRRTAWLHDQPARHDRQQQYSQQQQPAAAERRPEAAAASAQQQDITDEIALENEHSAQTLEIDHDRQQKQHGQQQIVLEALARLNSL